MSICVEYGLAQFDAQIGYVLLVWYFWFSFVGLVYLDPELLFGWFHLDPFRKLVDKACIYIGKIEKGIGHSFIYTAKDCQTKKQKKGVLIKLRGNKIYFDSNKRIFNFWRLTLLLQ